MNMPKLLYLLKNNRGEFTKENIFKNIIAGIVVAIIALPLSVALGISSGVSPEKGLITAVVAGFVISLLGGSRVQIGGPTGAFVVIIYGIISEHGIDGLILATIMAGVILIVFGALKLGTLIKYISYPITVGFTAGIAVTLFSTQVKDFLGLTIEKVPSEFIPKWGSYLENMGTINWTSTILGLFSLMVIILWPKINKKIPGSLIALILATIIAYFFKLPVSTIGSTFGEISSSISMPGLPAIQLDTLITLMKPAIVIAFLAAIESLLSAVVADGMIQDKHDSNMELIAQGVANVASGLFGGIPATGAIARTAANVKNGGTMPIAGIVHAITLFLIMKLLMPLAKYIPLTCLSAILMVVSYNMSEWRTFKKLLKAPKSDVITLIATFSLTVIFDLVVAIEIGIVVSVFLFMRKMAVNMEINELKEEHYEKQRTLIENIDTDLYNNNSIKIFEIKGAFFFGAAEKLMESVASVGDEAKVIILRMHHISHMDITAYDMIKKVESLCKERNLQLIISELREQPRELIEKMENKEGVRYRDIAKDLNSALKLAEDSLAYN
ncbi:sulfate permease, SulP family [Hathewaya proteolytica DSM 3090]|uniref:Sulfate permease, SulP family n=1 Tax=Hathewaya proteolytica DSM 3090 TaxID=1121331 RepID=A0A1M6QD09_9CLOT|nr:SulP family inorganic anion transporter [Hathewaya proteolytica]SHK18055.1 sulfate permease, SulP family [Hathewaya proteolytica DSM 3090]